MTRTDTIRTLLERRHELTDPQRSGNGHGTGGLTLMPHSARCLLMARIALPNEKPRFTPAICTCHLRSYQELDRLLEQMRTDQTHPLIVADNEKHSLRSLRWHIHQRYTAATFTLKNIRFVRGRFEGLALNQEIVGRPGGWELTLAEQRQKRSHTPVEMRVVVVTWNPEVRQTKLKIGIRWIGDQWSLPIEPELPVEKLVA